MTLRDPASAPPRADLTFLRRRARPKRPPQAAAEAPRSVPPIDYTHHSSAKTGSASSSRTSSDRPKIDFSRPDRTPPPATPPAPPSAAPPSAAPPSAATAASSGSGVDYHRPERERSSGSLELDLSGTGASSTPAARPRNRPAGDPLPRYKGPRVVDGAQVLLGRAGPIATLTRVQSGVGRLDIEAVCSADVGDLRLGALYQLRSGGTSTVQLAGGNRFAPSSRRPVIVASRDEYEHLAIDLRQVRDIERVSVYAFSESRTPLRWGGTLVITTFGGGRVELPIESLTSSTVAVLVSLYNLAGELVIRTELESIEGDIREAARAYGYDRITWRDDRSPVD